MRTDHPATVNRYLAALSAVCKWAWKELGWLPANPVLSVTKGAEHAGHRSLPDRRRAQGAPGRVQGEHGSEHRHGRRARAGDRRAAGNLRNLTWADVDLEHWRLRFTHTKNDQPRFVPLVGPAQAILQAHFDRDPTQKGWVFKGARDDAPADLDRPWRAVRKAAGLVGEKHCRFHDLRHTTASYLTMNGASLAEVAEALGHRTLDDGEAVFASIRRACPLDVRANLRTIGRGMNTASRTVAGRPANRRGSAGPDG